MIKAMKLKETRLYIGESSCFLVQPLMHYLTIGFFADKHARRPQRGYLRSFQRNVFRSKNYILILIKQHSHVCGSEFSTKSIFPTYHYSLTLLASLFLSVRCKWARSEVLTVVTMKKAVFWDMTPCDSCKNQFFGGAYRLHHQGDKNRRVKEQRCS
jgi:hypothetical protein